MIKFAFFLLFLHSTLFSNIHINKKAITVSLSSSLYQAKRIANTLKKYDIYIYKTTTTKKSYYVIYVVNINKENQTKSLKDIQSTYKDAYSTSDNRIKKLSSINFNKNIFIKSFQIPFYKNNEQLFDRNINLNKKSLFVTNVKNKKELFPFLKKYNSYDLFVERLQKGSLDNYDSCCSIYVVNINSHDYNKIFKTFKKRYLGTKKVQSTLLKYKNQRDDLNKFIKKSVKMSY